MATALSACASDALLEDETDSAEISNQPATAPSSLDWIIVDGDFTSGKADPDFGETPCDCTTDACLTSWVDTHFGCGVCVSFQCDNLFQHACNRCDESRGPAQFQSGDVSL